MDIGTLDVAPVISPTNIVQRVKKMFPPSRTLSARENGDAAVSNPASIGYDRAAVAANISATQWTTQVTIGGQVLNLLVDTGSSDLVRGFVAFDDVSVGASPPVLMAIEVATEVSETIKGFDEWDGILGLGFRDLNTVVPNKVDSFMLRLLESYPPTLPVFTVDLNPQRPHSKPTVEIGKIDREKANGDLQHAPVNNSSGWWAVDDISFEVDGQALPVRQTMIFDTGGSSTISVQPEVAAAYYNNTGAVNFYNDGTYYFPCSTKLPDLKMYIGNGTAIYRASLLSAPAGNDGQCVGVINGNLTGMGNVGGPFFEAHFVVFDYATPAIQYAPFL
ncbi:MAG: hypothetical protein Q9222_007403 [Ikaeria aurantiellina]